MDRPTGITLVALLYVLSGGIDFVLSWVTIAVGGHPTPEYADPGEAPLGLAPADAVEGELEIRDGLLGSGAALCKLVAAAGLLMLSPWGWRIALLRAMLNLATDARAAVQGAITPATATGALINLAVMVYLARPQVRRAFSGAALNAPTTP